MMSARGPIQVVILAGGLGTRLRPVTETVPKVMADVNGRPFLYYLVRLLRDKGCDRMLLLTGYRGDQVAEYFGDGSAHGVSIAYSRESGPLGTGGALRNCAAALDDVFLLLNGDTYFDFDVGALCAAHRCGSAVGTLAVISPSSGAKANVRLDERGSIIAYSKENSGDMTHIDAGAAVYSKKALDCFPGRTPLSLETDVFPILIGRGALSGVVVAGQFLDIGECERLANARKMLRV